MPRVSVVMPVYNYQNYVGFAIQSVLNQTYKDFELVITDNASTDRTEEAIKKFTDDRIRLFSLKINHGHSVGMNKCISEAKGEFIALLNADDTFYPEKLEKQVSILDKNPDVAAVFTYVQLMDGKGNDLADGQLYYTSESFKQPNKNRFEWLRHFFFHGNCLCYPSAVIRKQCLNEIGLLDPRFAQLVDFDLWLRVCMNYEIHIIPEKLVKFRVHPDQGSNAQQPETISRSFLEWIQILENYLNPAICDNLLKIFSLTDIKKTGLLTKNLTTKIDSQLVPFVIAMLALQVDRPAEQYFGCNLLYQMLDNQDIAQKLQEKYSFDFSKFLAIARQQDVFGIVSQKKLQFQLEQAQSEIAQLRFQYATLLAQSWVEAELEVPDSQKHYTILVRNAWYKYLKGDMSGMAQSLEQSLNHTPLSATETILNWLKIFDKLSLNHGEVQLDISSLTDSQEWRQVIDSILA